MNYSIKENTKKEATLEIVVSNEEFAKGLDFAFNKNKKYFTIPGFRKGKVPRKMVEKYYGVEVLFEDAVNEIIPAKYQEAAVDSKLDIVSQPEIDITSISVEEGFVFTAKVTLKPEVKIGEYKGIKAPKNEYAVKADDVNAEIDALKEKTVRIIERENGKVEKGDIVNIDYEGFCDGVAVPGGKAEGFDLTIGSGQFIPGFEDSLVGCELGATEINVKFPEEYHAEDLKGKDATFKVVINKISYKEYPELDDDFAKDVSEFDTFKELKADIKKKLTAEAKKRADQEFENSVIEKLVDLVEVEVPDCMVEERIENLANDYAYRLKSQGLELEQYLQFTGMSEESFKAQFKDRAEGQVKVTLALEEIAKIEKIEATDKDVEKEYEKMAEAYNMEVDKIKQFVNADDVKADMKMNKTVEFVVKNAVVEEATEAEKKPAAKKTTKTETAAKKPAAKKTTAKKADGETAKKTTTKKTTAKKAEG